MPRQEIKHISISTKSIICLDADRECLRVSNHMINDKNATERIFQIFKYQPHQSHLSYSQKVLIHYCLRGA